MKKIKTPLVRQGWLRALIYFAGISLIVYVFSNYATEITNHFGSGTEKGDETILQFGIIYTAMGSVVFLFTWVARKFIDRKSVESLGFSLKGFTNEAGLGFFSAIALLGIGTLILVIPGYLSFTGAGFDAGNFALQIVIMFIVALVEELLFRGYLLNNLMQSMNKWGALSITAALFSLFHGSNPEVTLFAVLNIFFAGILLGINYIFTKNLWFGIVFHSAWNFFQGPILGFGVSGLKLTSLLQQSVSGSELWTGGLFGFEGSLLCPLLFIVAVLIFAYAFIKRYEQPYKRFE